MVDVTEEYLKKFPLGLQKCLQDENEKARFSEEICSEYEPIEVYRGIGHTDKIVPEDFLGNVDRADACDIKMSERNRMKHKFYAVSVNEDLAALKKSITIPNKRLKIEGIAVGIMSSDFGPADFEKGHSHHNWYLFAGANEEAMKGFRVEKME